MDLSNSIDSVRSLGLEPSSLRTSPIDAENTDLPSLEAFPSTPPSCGHPAPEAILHRQQLPEPRGPQPSNLTINVMLDGHALQD
jgi:hypothetical protein